VLEPAEHDEASHWKPKKTFGHVMPQEPNVTCFHVRYTDCTCYQDELAVVINEIKKGNWKFSTIFSSQERRFLPLERRDLCNFDKYVCQVEMMDTWVALVPSLGSIWSWESFLHHLHGHLCRCRNKWTVWASTKHRY